MYKTTNLLKFAMLSSVCICVCFGKRYQSNHHSEQQLDQNRVKQTENPIQNEIIAKFNDTDAAVLAEVMQKEPKFFDEFECKYCLFPCYIAIINIIITNECWVELEIETKK